MVMRNEGSSMNLGYGQSLTNLLYSIEFSASGYAYFVQEIITDEILLANQESLTVNLFIISEFSCNYVVIDVLKFRILHVVVECNDRLFKWLCI